MFHVFVGLFSLFVVAWGKYTLQVINFGMLKGTELKNWTVLSLIPGTKYTLFRFNQSSFFVYSTFCIMFPEFLFVVM